MKRPSLALALGVLLLAGCSHHASPSTSSGTAGAAGAPGSAQPGGTGATSAGATSAGGGAGAAGGSGGGSGGGGDQSCSGGLKGNEPGVVRISCGGTATIQVQAGSASKAFHGGTCQSTGDYWSAAAGVVIDVTGTHGQYTGPKVDSVALNNTDAPGKGTIQLSLAGKNLYDLGGATMTLSADKKTAHFAGTSGQLSDAPGTKLVIDVTC